MQQAQSQANYVVVLSPLKRTAIDVIFHGKTTTACTGQTLAEIQADTPDAFCLPPDEAESALNNFHVSPVAACTEKEFFRALECLPPHRRERRGEIEFFTMSEFYAYDVTRFYVRVGEAFCTFLDRSNLSFEDVFKKVSARH